MYEYDTNHKEFNFLNKITGPFGFLTEIDYEYDSSGHRLPAGADIKYFPRVLLAHSGDSNKRNNRNSTHYEYSTTNYFGYGGNEVESEEDYDHSYRQEPTYKYSTTVTDKSSDRIIKHTYNRFHLEINKREEVVVDGKNMVIENITDYHDNKTGNNFNAQPPYFQQAKSIVTKHTELRLDNVKILREKTEVITYDKYDDYGNLLKFTNKDGAVTLYEYYPIA